MAKLCPLFSGSTGNGYYIGSSQQAVLIDAGKSAKQIELALKKNSLDISDIKAIFISHEHSDHVSGLRVFATRYNIKSYMSEGTKAILQKKGIVTEKMQVETVKANNVVHVGDMRIYPYSISHDCAEGLGYKVETADGKKVCIATDLGYVPNQLLKLASDCDTLVIESNHDIGMLENSVYPYELKRRILSNEGHLSNVACASVVKKIVKNGTTRIMLAHLSKENNMPQLAYQTTAVALEECGFENQKDYILDVAPEVNTGGHTFIF